MGRRKWALSPNIILSILNIIRHGLHVCLRWPRGPETGNNGGDVTAFIQPTLLYFLYGPKHCIFILFTGLLKVNYAYNQLSSLTNTATEVESNTECNKNHLYYTFVHLNIFSTSKYFCNFPMEYFYQSKYFVWWYAIQQLSQKLVIVTDLITL